MIPLDSFVGQSADGKMVPIIPGGNSIPLTFSNRKEYVERAIEYRLHEIDRQVKTLRFKLHVSALKGDFFFQCKILLKINTDAEVIEEYRNVKHISLFSCYAVTKLT